MTNPIRFLPALVVALGCSSSSAKPPAAGPGPRIERVVAGLMPAVQVKGAPPSRFTLAERMAHYRAPGLSIAVADSGRIVWARASGVKEAGTNDSITTTTVFEAGSISKPVAATAMLRLVEQGKLSLDENVNTYLKSWKLPDNRFTAKEKVTLRRIVSHNAGLTVHGFPGYSTTDSIPTVPQLLDGKKPANTAAVRVDTFPGAIWRYAGGGTTIQQLILTDVTGKSFPDLTKELVLAPIGMTNSTYQQPYPAARINETSAAHDMEGKPIPGRWHIYPEMAAAGLWTNPTDLLKWAIAIAEARAGRSSKVLSQAMATQMLTVQKAPTGLGPFLNGSGRGFNFGHGGSDEGFHSELVYFPETGQGAAVMVNSDGGPPILKEILYAIAAEYGWPDYGPRTVEALAVDSAALERVVGTYEAVKPVPITIDVTREGGKLFVSGRFWPKSEAVFTKPDAIVALDSGFDVHLVVDKSGAVTGLEAGPFKARRKQY